MAQADSDLRIIRRLLLALAILAGVAACYVAQEVLVPLVLATLIALVLSPAVSLLERGRLPRSLASIVVLAMLVGIFAVAVTRLAQPAEDWIAEAPMTMQTIQQRFDSFRKPLHEAQEATKKIEDLARPPSTDPTVVAAPPGLLATLATNTPHALGSIAVLLILVYFFLSSGNGILRRVVEIAPRLSDKKILVSIAREMQQEMSRYLLTVSLINIALGVATAAAMHLLGIPNALLLGAIACLLNFAPYVGPLTTGVVLLIAGFTTFDSLARAFAAPGIFFLMTFLEGQILTPMVIGRRLSLDPTAVFVWILLWGWLWGIVGVLLAGPMLACFRILCQHVQSLYPLGVLIGDGTEPEARGLRPHQARS